MLNRSLRLSCVVVCMFSGLLSFFVLFSYKQYAPVGPSWHVEMLDGDASGQIPVVRVNKTIMSYGREHGIDVVRRVADADNPRTVAHLYVVSSSGDSFARQWLKSGYNGFNPSMSYHIYAARESADTRASGEYFISGSEADARGLIRMLNAFGYITANFQSVTEPSVVLGLLGTAGLSLMAAPLTVLILLVSLVAVGVAANNRGYAIQRLQGRRRTEAFILDVSASGIWYMETLGAFMVLGVAGSFLYNHWHQLGMRLLLWLISSAIGVLIALVTHIITLVVVWHSPLHQAVKGAGSSRWILTAMYMVRILSLSMVFAVSSLAISDAVVLVKAQQRYDLWSGATRLGRISLGGGTFSAGGQVDMKTTFARVGSWERDLNRQGKLLIAVANPRSGMSNNKDLTVHGRPRDVLYINDAYLRAQNVTDSRGMRIRAPQDRTGVGIVIPQSYMDESAHITRAIDRDMKSRGQYSDIIPNATPHLDIITATSGQRRFTYTAADISAIPGGYQPESVIQDPIMVVLPNDTPFLSSGDYYGYTTWGSILALDTRQAISDTTIRPQLTRDVLGISPAAEYAAGNLATTHLSLATSILNVLLGLSATLVTTIGFAVVYARRRAQFIFASRINGWRYLTMFTWLFTLDVVLTTLIIMGVSASLWAILGSLTSASVAASPAIAILRLIIPIAGLLVSVGTVGMLMGAVVWCAKIIIRAHSTEVA